MMLFKCGPYVETPVIGSSKSSSIVIGWFMEIFSFGPLVVTLYPLIYY
jgi:hypothetical protein